MLETREDLLDHVAVLEWAIAEMTSAPPAYVAEMRERGVKLTHVQGRIYGRLIRSRGEWVPKDALFAAAYWDRWSTIPESGRIIAVHICNIRKKVILANVPVTITGWPKQGGYRLERTG